MSCSTVTRNCHDAGSHTCKKPANVKTTRGSRAEHQRSAHCTGKENNIYINFRTACSKAISPRRFLPGVPKWNICNQSQCGTERTRMSTEALYLKQTSPRDGKEREEGESRGGAQPYKRKFICYWAFLPARYHATELGWLPLRHRSWGRSDSPSAPRCQRAAPSWVIPARLTRTDGYTQRGPSWRGDGDKGRMQRSQILRASSRFKNIPSFSTTEKALLKIPQETSFPFRVPDVSADFSLPYS